MIRFRKSLLPLSSIFAAVSLTARSADPAAAVRLETLKTHSRLIFHVERGIEEVPVELQNTSQGFTITFKGLDLADLGAPLGDEKSWLRALGLDQTQNSRRDSKDPRISGIALSQTAAGVVVQGKWKYPVGRNAPANPRMEAFDYRDKAESQYVLDFWVKKGPTVAEVEAARRHAEHLAALKRAEQEAKKRADRRIAAEARKNKGVDIDKFCKDPLTDDNDVVLPFTPYHEEVNYSRWIPTTSPDASYVFREPKTQEKDAQYVRLALDLYRQGKHALVLRTIDFFDAEQAKSPYRTQMKFLRASALAKLGLVQESDQLLQRLMLEEKSSPEAVHSAMYLAAKLAKQKAYLLALEPFLWLIQNHPDHRLSWLFHLGVAESFYALKQTERASKEYRWVIENAQDRKQKAEAAVRMGDLYLARFQYEQALASYFQGINYFGDEANDFPSIHINRAETLYGLRNFERARPAFENFLKRFPDHPSGWRATYRLGEIAQRENVASSRDFYYETINRYPVSPGATLARLRLVTCGDQAGLTSEAGMRFFEGEAQKFSGDGEIVMVRYPEYRGLAQARALVTWARKEPVLEGRALEVAMDVLTPNRTPEFKAILKPMIGALFRRRVEQLLSEGKRAEAIALYQEKAAGVPWEERFVEPQYLLKLSQAAADLGLGKLAQELASTYRDGPDKSDRALASAASEGDAQAARSREQILAQRKFENESDDPESRLKRSEVAFTEAKALWVSTGGEKPEANERVRQLLSKVEEESPHSFERELMLGLIDQRAGRSKAALAHALKAQLLKPTPDAAAASSDPRMEGWLAMLQSDGGEPKIALAILSSLEKHVSARHPAAEGPGQKEGPIDPVSALGVPAPPSLEMLILTQARLLESQGRWGEAAEAYSRAVDAGLGGGQAIYGCAKALLASGSEENRKKGMDMLEKLSGTNDPKNELWKKLAREALETEKRTQSANAKEGNT